MIVTMSIVFVVLFKLFKSQQSQKFMIIVITFMQLENITFIIVLAMFNHNSTNSAKLVHFITSNKAKVALILAEVSYMCWNIAAWLLAFKYWQTYELSFCFTT